MRSSTLHIGDRIEANVRGVSFTATVTGKPPGLLAIEPEEPQRFTWRFVSPRQVVQKLEVQEKLGAAT